MAALLARIRRAARPPLQTMTPQAARAAYAASAEVLDLPRVALARVEPLVLDLDGGPRLARLYAADEGRLPVLLYLHGGGLVIGGLETHDSLCRQLALWSGVAVLALDYRLAPEHAFPAAFDDTVATLRWLRAHGAAALGLDTRRLAIGGDSAGATLAAAAAIAARDAEWPLALQMLITPGAAATAHHPSRQRYAQGFLLDEALIEWFAAQVLPVAARHDWRFAPLLADHLDGVAPACVLLAECDPLIDEGLAYADRLRSAGVAVELELWRGVTHDFIKMGRVLDEARQAQRVLGAALRRALQPD